MKFRTKLMTLLLAMGSISATAQNHPMTVEELFQKVETGSKSLIAQKSGIEMAEEGINTAKKQRLPEINTSLSVSYIGNVLMSERDFTDFHGYSVPHFGNNFALEAQQVVYAGGAIDAGIKLAELGKNQAEVYTQLTREQQRFLALGQYLELFKLDNRMKVIESNIALTKTLIANINDKYNQGMALKNDITRYELQMENLKLNLKKIQDQRSILNYQLCNTLGMSTSETIIPDGTIIEKAYEGLSQEDWQNAASQSASALKAATLNTQIAEQKERIAKSEMLPKIAIQAVDNFNGPITIEVPPIDKNLNMWYVGIGVQYSLSSLFKSNSKVKQAKIATRQSRENREAIAENINNQVQSAYTYYQQSFVELETQKKSVELAKQNYDVINERYLNQLSLVTDMVDASNMLLNSQLDEVDARINIVMAYYKMKYISGTL